MRKLRCLVVDDEELAREGLRFMLAAEQQYELVGTCADGLSAIKIIEEIKPDLVFLDVQMPGVNGFEVIASISKPRPYIIFTTAYEQYAIKAFEVNAIDYLLKPFTDARFKQALDKAMDTFEKDRPAHQNDIDSLLSHSSVQEKVRPVLGASQSLSQSIVVKADGKVFQLAPESILYVEAYDYYIKIHVNNRFFLVRETMKGMMGNLNEKTFERVHKSFIVNINHVKLVDKGKDGYTLVMTNDAEVKVSRSYRKSFLDKFQS